MKTAKLFLLILISPIFLFGQQTITGTVTDVETGEPLIGVNILAKGTTTGTITDFEGTYSLDVPEGASELVFSYTGYSDLTLTLGASTILDVTLRAGELLDEVVVVGYGTQKKVSLTGAVTPIDGETLSKRTVNNVQQSLQGQMSGLTVIDKGSSPGRSDMNLRVRGVTTIYEAGGDSKNDPLIIVDGIEQDITDINPLDIESVTVLKDASSTAIYGSRASNGVILVTTKRAKDQGLQVSLNSYYAIQQSNNEPVHMGLEDYMRMQNVAWMNSSGFEIYSEDEIREYVNATDRVQYPLPNTWYDDVLSAAPQYSNTLRVSGGSGGLLGLMSIRHQKQDGIIPNSQAEIIDFRLNTDYQISKRIKIKADLNYRNKTIMEPQNVGDVTRHMLQNSQFAVPRYPDGTYGVTSDGHSPLVDAELRGITNEKEDYLIGNLIGEYEVIDGLKLSLQYARRQTMTNSKTFRNKFEVRDYFDPSIVRLSVPINNLNLTAGDVRENTLNALVNFNRTYGKHTINVLGGYSEIHNTSSNLGAFRQEFYNNDVQAISQGANDATKDNTGTEAEWALRSYFARLNYEFQGKYLLEANIRHDGSSRFTGDNQYSTFPSFSAGWRISEEDFWRSSFLGNKVNQFKLRGSWGKTGNQAVGLYSFMATYDPRDYTFGGVVAPGYRQTSLSNRNITWETTTQTNIGVDVGMWDDRVTFSVDRYYQRTDDILLVLPVPATLGLDPTVQNAGRVDNEGWEFVLGLRNSFGDFGVSGNFNFNINNNEVVNLANTGPNFFLFFKGAPLPFPFNESVTTLQEGLPIYGWWGYETDGYFQSEEEIDNYPTIQPGIQPGDVKFIDRNGDGLITPDDRTFLGNSFPKYTFGANLSFSYKQLTLTAQFQGVAGVKARLGGALAEMGIWGGFTHEVTGDYWTPDNRDARFPRPLKFDLRNIVMADRDLLNGAYLRLKNLQLQYELPNSWLNRVGIQNASVYIATTNLLTFAALNDFNIDPEEKPGGRAEEYPQTSLTTFGMNIQF